MHQHIINQDHYSDAIMGVIASQIIRRTVVYSTVHSGADQRKYQSFASLAFVQGSHRWPVNSPYKWPVTRKMFPFDDVIVTVLIRRSRCLTKMWPIWWLSYKSVLTLISRTLLFPLNSTSIYIRSIELNRFFVPTTLTKNYWYQSKDSPVSLSVALHGWVRKHRLPASDCSI